MEAGELPMAAAISVATSVKRIVLFGCHRWDVDTHTSRFKHRLDRWIKSYGPS